MNKTSHPRTSGSTIKVEKRSPEHWDSIALPIKEREPKYFAAMRKAVLDEVRFLHQVKYHALAKVLEKACERRAVQFLDDVLGDLVSDNKIQMYRDTLTWVCTPQKFQELQKTKSIYAVGVEARRDPGFTRALRAGTI